MKNEFLTEWHRIVAERDLDGLEAILAEDITMGAPPYWEKLSGRPVTHFLLGLILHTIEDFTYHREWHDEATGTANIALEFRGRVGDCQLQGIDLITLDEQGRIQNLDVMIRPMNALKALRGVIAPKMMEFLASQSAD